MNRVNLRRSAKYFVALCVLYAAIMAVLCAAGMSAVPADRLAYVLLHTWRGAMLGGMALLLAATYPRFGFVKREVAADFDGDRERIVNVFASAGFVPTGETDGRITFRAASGLRRLRLMWEDEITVTRNGSGSTVIEGIRRVAVPAAFRIEAAARNGRQTTVNEQ